MNNTSQGHTLALTEEIGPCYRLFPQNQMESEARIQVLRGKTTEWRKNEHQAYSLYLIKKII
jgi:hypothetical protein